MRAIGATVLERVCRLPVELVANYTQSATVNTCWEVVSVVTQHSTSATSTHEWILERIWGELCAARVQRGWGRGQLLGWHFINSSGVAALGSICPSRGTRSGWPAQMRMW